MQSKTLLFVAPSLVLAALVAGACSDKTRVQTEMPSAAGAAVIAAQLPGYPLSACPVSGKTLGSMGEPYNYVHEGRLVRFCCDGCLDEFDADPSAYLAKIDAAAAADTATGG